MWYRVDADAIVIAIYVQPGAKKTEIAGIHDGALKIRLNVPPIEGRANDALKKYLAALFAVPVKHITLIRGEKTRRKTIKIVGSRTNPDTLCPI